MHEMATRKVAKGKKKASPVESEFLLGASFFEAAKTQQFMAFRRHVNVSSKIMINGWGSFQRIRSSILSFFRELMNSALQGGKRSHQI